MKHRLLILLFLAGPSISLAGADTVTVSLLPAEPHSANRLLGHVDYTVLSISESGRFDIIKQFMDVPFGGCATCKTGVAINCANNGRGEGHPNAEELAAPACRSGFADGIGMRLQRDRGTPRLALKNGSQYAADIDTLPLVNGQREFKVLLRPKGDAHAKALFEIQMLARLESDAAPAASSTGITTLPYEIPEAFVVPCQEGAVNVAKALVSMDGNASTYRSPYTVTDVRRTQSLTWKAAPGAGFGVYSVTLRSADGWDCTYSVQMAVLAGAQPARCALHSAHFEMCAR